LPAARLALALCRRDLVFVGLLEVRLVACGLVLVVLVVIFLLGRVGCDHQRDGRDGFAEQVTLFAEPKTVDAVPSDSRHRHGRSA
jgi:hypothetical protein